MDMKKLGGVALCVGVAVGMVGCSGEPPKPPVTSTVTTTLPAVTQMVTPTVTQTLPRETVTQVATVTYTPPPPAAKSSFTDGIWTVGQDVNPGVYRVQEAVVDGCYWALSTTGSGGLDLKANGVPQGGFPRITVSKGQDVESKDCGTWVKQ